MRGLFFSAALAPLALAGAVWLGFVTIGCDALDDSSGGTADAGCNGATCATGQFCLYRACSAAEACTPSTDTSCPEGTIAADCNGSPGCKQTDCAPMVQGCRTIPTSCGGDVTCACDSICGSAASCASVDGGTATCSGS